MILQLAGLFLLFTSSYAQFGYLEFIPGQYPDEPSLSQDQPILPDDIIPAFADAIKQLASVEDKIKLIYRFFNRPTLHRYVLDIILLIGNLNISDEGFGPYYKRADGLAALKPTLDEIKAATEHSAFEPTEGDIEASWLTEHDIGPSTAYQLTEHETEPSTEYMTYRSTQDFSEDDSRSAEEETESSTKYVIRESMEDDGQEDHQSSEEAFSISEFKQRIGLKHRDLKPEPANAHTTNEPLQAGSIRGIPGVHFPDYYNIPITSFSCADVEYIPGFYADLETGCQVFHVCWPHRRESFLCPVGTVFNQAILTCDYWYSTNCSLAPLFFDVNAREADPETSTAHTSTMIDDLIRSTRAEKPVTSPHPVPTTEEPLVRTTEHPKPSTTAPEFDWSQILKFLPVKSKVVIYPEYAPRTTAVPLQKPKHTHTKSKLVPKSEGKTMKKAIIAQIIKEVLEAAEKLENVQPLSGVASVGYLPVKSVHVNTGKRVVKPTRKPSSLLGVIPKFVVQPSYIRKEYPRVPIRKQFVGSDKSAPVTKTIPPKESKPVKAYKIKSSLKPVEENVPEIVMRALEMAGTVLQRDILPLTRQSLIENYVKRSKSKH